MYTQLCSYTHAYSFIDPKIGTLGIDILVPVPQLLQCYIVSLLQIPATSLLSTKMPLLAVSGRAFPSERGGLVAIVGLGRLDCRGWVIGDDRVLIFVVVGG
jgi:hypothetical protein